MYALTRMTCLLGERLVLLLQSRGVVGKETSGLDLGRNLGELMSHRLEVTDSLAELLALVGDRDRLVEGALSEADHLGSDADATCTDQRCSDTFDLPSLRISMAYL